MRGMPEQQKPTAPGSDLRWVRQLISRLRSDYWMTTCRGQMLVRSLANHSRFDGVA